MPKKRKPASVIIKNMRGSKTMSQSNIEMNEDGTPMSEEEMTHRRKYVDFTQETFPEVNPIELLLPEYKGSGQVRFQTYRYPAATSSRKGIVHYIHGLNDYAGRYAFIAKKLAQNGYDVVAMDQRGFGFSQGTRGFIPEPQLARDDLLAFTQKVSEQFGGDDVPLFTMGHSLGGALQLLMAAEAPQLIKGMTLITPFIGLAPKQQEEFDKLKTMMRIVNYVAPHYQFNMKKEEPTWLHHWRADPNDLGGKVNPNNVLKADEASQMLMNEIVHKVKTPYQIITAGQDDVCSTPRSQEFFDLSPAEDKEIIDFQDANHMII